MKAQSSRSVNPTVLVFFVALAAFYGSLYCYQIGYIGLYLAASINSVALYSIYSVSHDATHGIAVKNIKLNNLLGRISAFHEGMTFPMFKLSHGMHHGYTNHPEKDPDYVIGRKPRLLLPLWVVVRLIHDNSYMVKQGLWKKRPEYLVEHVISVMLQISFFIFLSTLFGAEQAFMLWVVPVFIAGALVELLVAWLVHYPHESQEKLEHTRLIKSKFLQVVMFNHNLHVVHHLWPKVPWYEYPEYLEKYEALVDARTTDVKASEPISLIN